MNQDKTAIKKYAENNSRLKLRNLGEYNMLINYVKSLLLASKNEPKKSFKLPKSNFKLWTVLSIIIFSCAFLSG